VDRIQVCHAENNTAICIAGFQGNGQLHDEKKVVMPLAKAGDPKFSVYSMLRYRDTDKKIASLATQAACLPLFLAGSSVSSDQIVVELGPFAGLSSKCIVSGMLLSSGGIRKHAYLAYDTFEGRDNYRSIVKRARWVKRY